MNRMVLGLLSACVLAAACHAADQPMAKDKEYAAAEPETPAKLDFANTWAQNGPYSLENLKGKAVVLYFYVDT